MWVPIRRWTSPHLATDDVEGFLDQAGEVFVVHRGHDSGNA